LLAWCWRLVVAMERKDTVPWHASTPPPAPPDALIMDAAAVGIAQQEDQEEGIDPQDSFYRVVFVLAAIQQFPLIAL
jgi:hypothetical protein